MDLAVTSISSDIVATYVQRGSGLTRVRTHTMHGSTSLDPVAVAAGDLNGDGKADLAVGNVTSNSVSIMLSRALLAAPTTSIGGTATVGVSGPPHTLNLLSDAYVPLTIGQVALSGPNAADFEVIDACSNATLPFERACTIDVTFTPTAVRGPGRKTCRAARRVAED